MKFFYDWDWPGAEREFERAIALKPNYATALNYYSYARAADVRQIIEEHIINGRVVERLALLKVPAEGKTTTARNDEGTNWEA